MAVTPVQSPLAPPSAGGGFPMTYDDFLAAMAPIAAGMVSTQTQPVQRSVREVPGRSSIFPSLGGTQQKQEAALAGLQTFTNPQFPGTTFVSTPSGIYQQYDPASGKIIPIPGLPQPGIDFAMPDFLDPTLTTPQRPGAQLFSPAPAPAQPGPPPAPGPLSPNLSPEPTPLPALPPINPPAPVGPLAPPPAASPAAPPFDPLQALAGLQSAATPMANPIAGPNPMPGMPAAGAPIPSPLSPIPNIPPTPPGSAAQPTLPESVGSAGPASAAGGGSAPVTPGGGGGGDVSAQSPVLAPTADEPLPPNTPTQPASTLPAGGSIEDFLGSLGGLQFGPEGILGMPGGPQRAAGQSEADFVRGLITKGLLGQRRPTL